LQVHLDSHQQILKDVDFVAESFLVLVELVAHVLLSIQLPQLVLLERNVPLDLLDGSLLSVQLAVPKSLSAKGDVPDLFLVNGFNFILKLDNFVFDVVKMIMLNFVKVRQEFLQFLSVFTVFNDFVEQFVG